MRQGIQQAGVARLKLLRTPQDQATVQRFMLRNASVEEAAIALRPRAGSADLAGTSWIRREPG